MVKLFYMESGRAHLTPEGQKKLEEDYKKFYKAWKNVFLYGSAVGIYHIEQLAKSKVFKKEDIETARKLG